MVENICRHDGPAFELYVAISDGTHTIGECQQGCGRHSCHDTLLAEQLMARAISAKTKCNESVPTFKNSGSSALSS